MKQMEGRKKIMKFVKKIFSVKDNSNFYKIVTILGIKFKILNLKKVVPTLERVININDFIRDSFTENGASPELILYLSTIFTSPQMCKNLSNESWLIYISCLISANQTSKALSILKEYINIYGYKDIERYLYISHFAYINNYRTDIIEKSNKIFLKLKEQDENKYFEKLLRNKTIAIVGNGPQEIGLSKGAEIDAHDVVVRLNNYRVNGYERDYGSKTDIWVRGFGGDDILDYTATNDYIYSGITGNYFRFPIFWEKQLNILYRDLIEKKCILDILIHFCIHNAEMS